MQLRTTQSNPTQKTGSGLEVPGPLGLGLGTVGVIAALGSSELGGICNLDSDSASANFIFHSRSLLLSLLDFGFWFSLVSLSSVEVEF